MHTKIFAFTIHIAFVALLVACNVNINILSNSSNLIEGSGIKASEMRRIDNFTGIDLKSSAEVNIVTGMPQEVSIITDDNLLNVVTTKVTNGKLIIGSNQNYSTKIGVTINITVPDLNAFQISGSGDVNIENLSNDKFLAVIQGSGNIRATGMSKDIEVLIQGSGDMDFKDVTSRQVVAQIDGSGSINIHATETLNIQIAGSGDVNYWGSPRVTSKIIGSGDIIRK